MDPKLCEEVCRLCADHGNNYASIFDSNSECIEEKIRNCLPININKNDNLPSHICSECLKALNISDELRKKSLESDKKLRQQFNIEIVKIKEEKHDDDDEDDDENVGIDAMFCGICEIDFDDVTLFDDHMEEFHLSKWVCNLCNENFKTSDDLLQHKYTNHYDNMDNTDEADDNIDDISDADDKLENDDRSVDMKPEAPSTSNKMAKQKPIVNGTIVCDICNVGMDNEKQMDYHRKFHAPRAITCWICDIKYPSAYDLFLHKQDVHGYFKGQKMKYCCENCERFVSCFKVFRRHINCKNMKLKCQYCDREFSKRIEFAMHQKKNHRDDMMKDPNCQKYNCGYCDKMFVNESYFKFHMRTHAARKEEKYKCEKCNKHFANSAHLKAHLEGVHDKLPKYECDLCTKTFCTRRNLQAHKKRHVNQTCQECEEEFENMRALSIHLKNVHNVNLPVEGQFSCKLCPRKFPKLRLLEDHLNIHSGKQPHVCETCHKTFRTYAARWSHEQGHKREAYCCDYCQQKFMSKQNLARHIMGHMPPEDWKYECQQCNVKFKRTSHLKAHEKTHSEDHAYRCDICDARYLRKHHMLRHRKRHSQKTQ